VVTAGWMMDVCLGCSKRSARDVSTTSRSFKNVKVWQWGNLL
jgi:hypothetical protein